MKSINASFSAMSRTITEMGKAMRQEHKPEIQEAERQWRTERPVPSVATVPSVTGTPPSPTLNITHLSALQNHPLSMTKLLSAPFPQKPLSQASQVSQAPYCPANPYTTRPTTPQLRS